MTKVQISPPVDVGATESFLCSCGASYVKLPVVAPGGTVEVSKLHDSDFQRLKHFRWRVDAKGYVSRKGISRLHERTNDDVRLHRVIKPVRRGYVVDHRNRDKLDNRSCNLREATVQQNMQNRRRNPGRTRFIGVSLHNNRFQVEIGHRYIGRFDTAAEAAHVYDSLAIQLYGEFAQLNFPRSRS